MSMTANIIDFNDVKSVETKCKGAWGRDEYNGYYVVHLINGETKEIYVSDNCALYGRILQELYTSAFGSKWSINDVECILIRHSDDRRKYYWIMLGGIVAAIIIKLISLGIYSVAFSIFAYTLAPASAIWGLGVFLYGLYKDHPYKEMIDKMNRTWSKKVIDQYNLEQERKQQKQESRRRGSVPIKGQCEPSMSDSSIEIDN
jgi:hypothetical protein